MSDSEAELLKQREKYAKKRSKKDTPEKGDKKKRKHSDLKDSNESSQPSQSPKIEETKKVHKEKKSKASSQDSSIENSPAKSPKKPEKKSSSKPDDTVQEMELETTYTSSKSTPLKDKLTFSYQKSDDALPYIIHFPQGMPPEVANNPDTDLNIESFRNAEKRKQHQYSIVCETPLMQYNGKNFGSDALRENLTKYVIGIHNKKTGKVKMVEAQGMFSMSQKIKNVAANVKTDNSIHSLSNAQKKLELVTAFGSKRLQKSYIRDDGSVLDKTTELTGESDLLDLLQSKNDEYEQSIQKADAGDLYPDIPPADFQTPETKKVYEFKKMILPPTQQHLKPIAEDFAAAVMDGEDSNAWTHFIDEYQLNSSLVSYVVRASSFQRASNEKKTEKCIMLLYLGILMKLYKQIKIMQKDNIKREEAKNEVIIKKTGIPEFILRDLLRIFCAQNDKKTCIFTTNS